MQIFEDTLKDPFVHEKRVNSCWRILPLHNCIEIPFKNFCKLQTFEGVQYYSSVLQNYMSTPRPPQGLLLTDEILANRRQIKMKTDTYD